MNKISEEIKRKVRNQIGSVASILGIKDIDYLFNKIRKVEKRDKIGLEIFLKFSGEGARYGSV
jgi:hypothetical protein